MLNEMKQEKCGECSRSTYVKFVNRGRATVDRDLPVRPAGHHVPGRREGCAKHVLNGLVPVDVGGLVELPSAQVPKRLAPLTRLSFCCTPLYF